MSNQYRFLQSLSRQFDVKCCKMRTFDRKVYNICSSVSVYAELQVHRSRCGQRQEAGGRDRTGERDIRILRALRLQQGCDEEVPLGVYPQVDLRDHRARSDPRQGRCEPRRRGDEEMGHGPGSDALHPLVPAPDRRYRGEARFLHRSPPPRRGHGEFQRQAPVPAGARRVLVPQRRSEEHLRGKGIHRLGSLVPGVRHRGHAVHPHRFRFIHRRGAGLQDASAEVRFRGYQGRQGHPGILRRGR